MTAEASDSPSFDESEKPSGLNRWSSWLLLTAIGLPMISAYLVFNTGWGIPSSSINKGDLVLPATSMVDHRVSNSDGEAIDLFSGKKKWRWLIIGNNLCSDRCENNLYLSRQVHIRLGEKAVRLERIYLNTETAFSPELSERLSKDHPRLRQLHTDASEWTHLLANSNANQVALNGENLYMVDQEGFVMMTYNRSHSGAELLADVKRLLKYSYDE
ncbi:MAG: hypothetical protein ACRBBW_13320 [Cellvibrionaceae bacterium]